MVTIGGTCAVSLTPFSYLASRYPDDLAVIWLDSHADSNLPGGPNCGFNTMVVTHLSGHGDPDVLEHLPATVAPERILLAGVHGWDDQDSHTHESWGLSLIPPAEAESSTVTCGNGCATVGLATSPSTSTSTSSTATSTAFGMAWEKDGISKATALGLIAMVADEFDLVGLTVAEFVPREAVALRSMLSRLPLLKPE